MNVKNPFLIIAKVYILFHIFIEMYLFMYLFIYDALFVGLPMFELISPF